MYKLITIVVFVLSLLACSADQVATHQKFPQSSTTSDSAQQLIEHLNARYQSTVAQCSGGTPAYYCSGIILRTSTYSPDFDFWTHSPGAVVLGSVTFSYIRRDIGTSGADLASGFIFSDQETALAENKAQTLRCIYPFMAGTQGVGRPGFGCGFIPTRSLAQEVDLSTCATLATPAITPELWLENFLRFGSNPVNQCSLSTQVASQFQASLQAHNLVDAALTASRNELLIATWREDAPQQLPIEAFFYNATSGITGLANAQALRHAYYQRTGQRLPIVRLNFTAADRNIFSSNIDDQIDGWEVAAQLNARYNNTSNNCTGRAAYYCDGVMIRVTTYDPSYHSWNPNPSNSTGVSFTYLRKDLQIHTLAYGYTRPQGYIFKEAEHFGKPGIAPLAVTCSFPFDGATDLRDRAGCGATTHYFPDTSGLCDEQGITTVDQWYAHFISYPVADYSRFLHQCGFNADQVSFTLSLNARIRAAGSENGNEQNEILISKWEQDIPHQLPIEAFIHIAAAGIPGARFIQNDFYQQTGKFIPVIGVALNAAPNDVFSYQVSEQGN